MKTVHRVVAMAGAACLAGMSAACSGGFTNASSPTTPASSSTTPASSSDTGSGTTGSGTTVNVGGSPSTGAGTTVNVGGSLGTFPTPPGATVVEKSTTGSQTEETLSGVTPSALSSFYATALPQDGYTITSNTLATVAGITAGEIDFTGHGYKGVIGDAAGVIGITLTPR